MLAAYNNLRDYRRSQAAVQYDPYGEPVPDTTGWVEATPWEKEAHKWFERGERWSDPIGYSEAWERTKGNLREGKFNPMDFAETFGKFAVSVVPSMIGGFMMHPQYWTELATGHNLNSMYDGKYDPTPLRDEQKAADALYMGLDYLSFIPGVGAAGTLARTGARAGARVIGKQATRETAGAMQEAAEQAAKNQFTAPRGVLRRSIDDRVAAKNPTWVKESKKDGSYTWKDTVAPEDLAKERKVFEDKWNRNMQYSPSERAGQNFMQAVTGNPHPYIGSILGAMGEEAGQEFMQTMMEDVRGVNGDPEGGWSNVDIQRDLEGAMFGALGGGMFGTANVGINKGIEYLDKENTKRREIKAANGDPRAFAHILGKAYRGDEEAAEALERVADSWATNTDKPRNPNGIGGSVTQDMINAYEEFDQKRDRTYSGFSATALSDGTVNGQDAYLSAFNVVKAVSSGDVEARENIINGIFGDIEGLEARAADTQNPSAAASQNILTLRQEALEAASHNDVQTFCDKVNDAILLRERLGEDVVVVFVRQPMNSKVPFKLRLRGLRMAGGSMFVSEEVMSAAGGDFDGDMAQAFSPEALKGARWFYNSLSMDNGSSSVSWDKAYLDIGDDKLGFTVPEVKAALGRSGAHLGEGQSFTFKVNGTVFTANNDDELPTVIAKVLFEIKSIKDKGKRQAAISSFINTLWNTDFNGRKMDMSMFLGYLRDNVISSKMYEMAVPITNREIVEGVAADYQAPERASRGHQAHGTEMPMNIQGTPNNPRNAPVSEFEAQIGIETSLPSEENNGEIADNYRGKFWTTTYVHHKDAREGTASEGSEEITISLYDMILAAALQMEEGSDHAAINLNKAYYHDVLMLIIERMHNLGKGDKLSFDRDTNLQEIFNDDLIAEINDRTGWHNLALQRAFANGETGTVPGGFTKDGLEGNSDEQIAKFLLPIIEDDIYVSELLGSFLDDDTVSFLVMNDINLQQPIRNLLEQLQGRPDLPAAFLDTVFIRSDGTTNDSIRDLFVNMKEAYDDNAMGGDRTLQKELSDPYKYDGEHHDFSSSMTKEEFKEKFPEVPDEEIEVIFDNDEYKIFQRYGHLMGHEIFHELGWDTLDDFRYSQGGRALLDAKTAADRLNIAFSLMFQARTARLSNKAFEILDDAANWREHVDSIMKWRHVGSSNNNPIWQALGSTIDALAVDAFNGKDVDDITPTEAIEFAKGIIRTIDLFTNKNVSLDTKLDSLVEHYWGGKEINKNIPWFIWLRAGWHGHPHMMNMTLKIARANMQTSNMSVDNFRAASADFSNLQEYWEARRISPETREATMRYLSDEANVEVDMEIRLLAFMVTVYPDSALSEKAKSHIGLGLENQAITLESGESYTPMFSQYTTSLTNAQQLEEFGKNRRIMMGIFWGTEDPKTKKPYCIPVTDPKTGRSMLLDTKKMFGVDSLDELEGPEGWAKREKFLENNPFFATYFYPARLEMIEVGDIKTVSMVRRTGKDVGNNLKEVWEKANFQRQRFEAASRTHAKSILEEIYEARFKKIIHKSKAFNVLWVLATKKFDKLDSTNVDQVNAVATQSYQDVEDFLLWLCNEYINGRNDNLNRVLSGSVAKAAERNYDSMVGLETSLDQMLDAVISSGAILSELFSEYSEKTKVMNATMELLDAIAREEQNDPNASGYEHFVDFNEEETQKYHDNRAIVDAKERFVRKRVVSEKASTNLANTSTMDMIREVPIDQILEHVTSDEMKEKVSSLYKDGERLSKIDRTKNINVDTDNEVEIPNRPKANRSKSPRKRQAQADQMKAYETSLKKFFDGTPWGITGDDIDAYIKRLNKALNKNDEEKASNEDRTFWMYVDRKLAQYHIRNNQSKINTTDAKDVADLIINSANTLISEFDEQYGTQITDDGQALQIGPEIKPKIDWQIYNPANVEAAKTIWDAMKSEDSELGITQNGMTPEVIAALAFMRSYYCEGTTEETNFEKWVADINEAHIAQRDDGVKNKRIDKNYVPKKYILSFDGILGYDGNDEQEILKEIVEFCNGEVLGDNQVKISITDNSLIDPNSLVEFFSSVSSERGVSIEPYQVNLRVYDVSDDTQCSSGLCNAHHAHLIDWLLEISQGAQEDRLMQTKKIIDSSFIRIKGMVNDGTVLDPDTFTLSASSETSGVNPNEILKRRNAIANDLAESMKQNAVEDAKSGHGRYDSTIDMDTHALPLSQLLTSCVTIKFKNGDMASIGVEAIYAAKHESEKTGGQEPILVKDPLYKEGVTTTHNEFINWDDIDSVEIIPLSFDDWASHIVSSIEPELQDFVAKNDELSEEEKEKAPYALFAKKAMLEWGERNRYCQETGEDNRLTVERVLANIAPLGYKRAFIPTLNVLPSPKMRYFGHAFIPRTSRAAQRVEVSQETLENEFSRFRATKDMEQESGRHKTMMNIVYIEDAISPERDSQETLNRFRGIRDEKRTGGLNNKAREISGNDKYIYSGAVLVLPGDNIESAWVQSVAEKAMRSDATLLLPGDAADEFITTLSAVTGIPETTLRTNLGTGYNLVDDAGEVFDNGGHDYVSISFEDINLVNGFIKDDEHIPFFRGIDEKFKAFCFLPYNLTPTGDSVIWVTKSMWNRWKQRVFSAEGVFDLPFEDGEWHLLDRNTSRRQLEDLRDDIIDAMKIEDVETREKELAEIFKWKKQSKAITGDQKPKIDHAFIAQRTVDWIEKALKDDTVFTQMSNVKQDDVIGVAFNQRYNRYVPIIFGQDHRAPTNGALVRIAPYNEQKGSTVRFEFDFKAESIKELTAMKIYLNNIPGQKAMAVFMEAPFDIDPRYRKHWNGKTAIHEKDFPIELYGIMDWNTQQQRIAPRLLPRLKKLSLFVELRQYTPFDLIPSAKPTEFIAGPRADMTSLTDEMITSMLVYKGKMRAEHKSFWKLWADGKLYLAGHNPNDLNERGGQALQSLIQACLKKGVNPALLFSSVNHRRVADANGEIDITDEKKCPRDEWVTEEWDMLLSETTNGIDLDTVMAYCHLVDENFCPEKYDPKFTADEFLASNYHTDGDCRHKIPFDGVDRDGNEVHKIVAGIIYFTTVGTDGTVTMRDASNSAAINSRIRFVNALRNGPTNPRDALSILKAVREHYSTYSRDDIARMYDSDDEYWDNIEAASTEMPSNLMVAAGLRTIPRTIFGKKKADIREILDRHDSYYKSAVFKVTDPQERNGTLSDAEITARYEDVRKLDGCSKLTKTDYYRLIRAISGWTPTKEEASSEKIQAMPHQVFVAAHDELVQRLHDGEFPISTNGEHWIAGRPVTGHIEPESLLKIIKHLKLGGFSAELNFNEIANGIKRNIQEMKAAESPLDHMKDDSRRRAVWDDLFYADAIWNGIDERMVLEHQFSHDTILANEGITELEKIVDGKYPEKQAVRKKLEDMKNDYMKLLELDASLARIPINVRGENEAGIEIENNKRRETVNRLVNTAIELRQMMAMMSPVISAVNIMDTFKGTLANSVLNKLGRMGIWSPYRISMQDRIRLFDPNDPESTKKENDAIKMIIESQDCQDYAEARMMAQTMGRQYLVMFEQHVADNQSPASFIDKYRSMKFMRRKKKRGEDSGELVDSDKEGRFETAYAITMRIGSGQRLFKRRMLKNFMWNFLRIAGEYGAYELEEDGVMKLGARIQENPEQAFQMMWRDYNEIARIAWEQTMQNSIAHETALSFFLETMMRNHPILKFLVQAPGGVTFIRATINISRRILRNVIPGISASEYVIQSMIADANLENNPMLARILSWSGVDAEKMQKEFAGHPEWKTYTSLREAILVDLCHMTLPMFGLTLATIGFVSGAIEPPDDDDLKADYWEWSFFGVTFQQQWWLQDLIGPILPWICFYYSVLEDKPDANILLNGVEDFINMSPFVHLEDFVDIAFDPESAYDSFGDDVALFADAPDGGPDLYTAFCGRGKAASLSLLASFITPKIFKDINTFLPQREVSYNRAYVYDADGNHVYNEDGTLQTRLVTYEEAQIRRVTKNSFMLGFILDGLNGAVGNEYIGYTRDAMPNQRIYDSAQLQFEHTMSVWDYENETYKDEDDIEATCSALLLILDQNDDMDALWHEGFYLDARTKDALSAYIWGLYQNEIDEFNNIVQSGGLDYVYLGNGDWNEGQRIASEMWEAHYDALNYYEDLYYNKLRSRELNQGLVAYERYNTTYKQDANGEWYATGFQQHVGAFSPIMPNQAGLFGDNMDLTTGHEGSWATRSAVTGQGMYNDEGKPYRGLIPVVEDNYEWKTFEELGQLMGITGDNSSSGSDARDDAGKDTKGGWGYTYSRGGGGGGGRGGSVRLANRNYASTSKAVPAYGYNYNKRLSPHSMNPVRPNFPNSMQGGRIYDPQLDYLRPNFETKGSREAYRRQDF